MSNHHLKIETGQHKNIAVKERICDMCQENSIEDEYHFLISRSLSNQQRKNLFSEAQNENYNSIENKFDYLMRCSKNMVFPVALYISYCMEIRQQNAPV